MAGERFDYSQVPALDDFKALLRPRPDLVSKYRHPVIEYRKGLADELNSRIAATEIPGYVDPRLIPNPVDQPLAVTSFDEFEGMEPAVPPEMYIEGWRRLHEYNLMLANHPARIWSMQQVEARGFHPPRPPKEETIIERCVRERNSILQLSDLGQNVDVAEWEGYHDWQGLKQEDRKELVERALAKRQVHRTEVFATGVFSMIGKQARSYINVGAMPDTNGSVLALTTAARMHMMIGVPEVGSFSDPAKQAALAKAALDELNINDPILKGRGPEEAKYIANHWRSNVVGVLEVTEDKALARAALLAKAGVRTFRVYGHTQGGDVARTVRALRREYPDFEIIASQVINVPTALACEDMGADAIITGVGSGGRCTTADKAQYIPENAIFSIHCGRAGLSIPVIGEGGAIDDPVICGLVGMSGVNGSGSILGGTFEAPGGAVFLSRNGKFYKTYSGEAGPPTKEKSGRTYPTGIPYFPEGAEGLKELDRYEVSATQKLNTIQERCVLGAVMLGIDQGPFTKEAIRNAGPNLLFEKSRTTFALQGTH